MPVVRVADPAANAENICAMIGEAAAEGVSLLAFPELSVTGYTCGDLFGQQRLVEGAEEAVRRIMEYTRGKSITVVAGAPVRYRDRLYNCAVVIRNGNIKANSSFTAYHKVPPSAMAKPVHCPSMSVGPDPSLTGMFSPERCLPYTILS